MDIGLCNIIICIRLAKEKGISTNQPGCLHGQVVKVSRFEHTLPSPPWFGFESNEKVLSIANGRLLVQSKEQSVPPTVEKIAMYNLIMFKMA